MSHGAITGPARARLSARAAPSATPLSAAAPASRRSRAPIARAASASVPTEATSAREIMPQSTYDEALTAASAASERCSTNHVLSQLKPRLAR